MVSEGPSEGRSGGRIRALQLVCGTVLGFLADWFVFTVSVFTVYANYGDSTGTVQDVLAFSGLLGPPIVLGLLLVPRRTRYWGTGFLMGVAIGAMTGAGVCAGFLGLNAL